MSKGRTRADGGLDTDRIENEAKRTNRRTGGAGHTEGETEKRCFLRGADYAGTPTGPMKTQDVGQLWGPERHGDVVHLGFRSSSYCESCALPPES